MKILVLNAGSSSHKVSLYQLGESLPGDPPPPLWEAKIDWHDHIGADAVEQLVTTLWRGKSPVLRSSDDIDMVGHRIVHGGRQYEEPVRITPAVKAGITGVSAFAPLHNRGELEVIDVIEKLLGDIPQVAVFDTGFHRSIPPAAAVYPDSPLRLSRDQPSVLCRTRGATPETGPENSQARNLPSRQWL